MALATCGSPEYIEDVLSQQASLRYPQFRQHALLPYFQEHPNLFVAFIMGLVESEQTETEKEIERLLHDGDRVSIPFNRKTLRRGKAEVFGIGISNPLNAGPEFTIIAEAGPWIMADGTEGTPEAFVGFIEQRTVVVPNNEFEVSAFPVDAPRDALPGTYIINVYICHEAICDSADSTTWYDGYVHKLYVEVK